MTMREIGTKDEFVELCGEIVATLNENRTRNFDLVDDSVCLASSILVAKKNGVAMCGDRTGGFDGEFYTPERFYDAITERAGYAGAAYLRSYED